jgi:chromate transporter
MSDDSKMTDDSKILALVLVFAPLSLVSIGGGPAILAEMQHQAVTVQGWMSQREFADLFAIARAAPGPGMLLVTLIGWHVAGWLGVVAVSLAFFLPSSLLVLAVAQVWTRWRGTRLHGAIEAGFAPLAVGLVFAGALAILATGQAGALTWVVALAVAAARIVRPRLQPLILLALGAALFALVRAAGW